MKLQFRVTFKLGQEVIADVLGREDVGDSLTIEDVTEHVIRTEQFLERLTGLRVHISQVG